MSGLWDDWVFKALVGVAFWAVYYLLAKVRYLEFQIRVLKSEDKRLDESIEALYHVHNRLADDVQEVHKRADAPLEAEKRR